DGYSRSSHASACLAFQLRSAREKGHQAVLDGNRRSVPVWAQEPNRKMGRSASDAPAGDDDESRRNKFVEQYFRMPNPTRWWRSCRPGSQHASWWRWGTRTTIALIWSTSSAGGIHITST